ncbi:hypothetical protein ACFQMA_13935 [Halosimplex aquaticum]|uniref:Phage-related protein n=1 Tax=Halosimplex aquaticum TaxID=3026162 RepID=A0ABD5Y6F9_9EURY|nr:hypothetical protein [Halosimplex aquaticum]
MNESVQQRAQSAAENTTKGMSGASDRLRRASSAASMFGMALNGLLPIWESIVAQSPKLQSQLAGMGTQFEALASSLGSTLIPAFRLVSGFVKSAVSVFRALPSPVRRLVGIAFALTTALVGLGAVVATAQGAVAALAVTFGSLLTPILVASALIAGLYAVWTTNLFGIKQKTAVVLEALKQQFQAVVEFVRPIWEGFVAGLKQLWNVHGSALASRITTTMSNLTGGFKQFVAVTKPLWEGFLTVIAALVKVHFAVIKTVVLTVMDALLSTVRLTLALMQGDFDGAVQIVVGYVQRLVDRINGFASRIQSILGGLGDAAISWATEMMSQFLAGITAKTEQLLSKIAEVEGAVVDPLSALPGKAITWAKDILTKLVEGIDAKIEVLRERAQAVADDVTSPLSSLSKQAAGWGRDVIGEFVSGIKDKISAVRSAISDVKSEVTSRISFDIPSNDRMARRWGADLITHFSRGVQANAGLLHRSLPGTGPRAMGLPQPQPTAANTTAVDVTVEAGAVQLNGRGTDRLNAERTAEGIGEEMANQFGRR